MSKRRNKTLLTCGCCGTMFRGYQHWNHDNGYGDCPRCEDWLAERNRKELDGLADKIEAALSPENAAKFKAMDPELRRAFACKAIEDGMVTWKIERHGTGIVTDRGVI